MTIDSHHHFWNYSADEYAWIDEKMGVLKRDFGPSDLQEIANEVGLDGVISVQARSVQKETDYLVEFGKKHPLIKGVVGWVDLNAPDIDTTLGEYSREPLVKGFRHVLQGEPDERYMLRTDFNRGVARLQEFGFIYEILIFHYHLRHTPTFVDQHHDGQIFVIDHIAKPKIATNTPDPDWTRNMREIAKRENVYCKVSGMVTEVVDGVEWSPDLLRPYFDVVLEAFGPDRLMYGSDWPVCLIRSDYAKWIATVRSWIQDLSQSEQASIMGETAIRAYGLRE